MTTLLFCSDSMEWPRGSRIPIPVVVMVAAVSTYVYKMTRGYLITDPCWFIQSEITTSIILSNSCPDLTSMVRKLQLLLCFSWFQSCCSFCGQSLTVSVSKWVNLQDDAAGKQKAAERLQCEDFNRTVWADGRKRRRSASSYWQTHIYKHSHTYTQHTLCRRDSCTLTCASSDFVVLSLVFFTLSRSLAETRTCTCVNQIVIADWLNLSGIRLIFHTHTCTLCVSGKSKSVWIPSNGLRIINTNDELSKWSWSREEAGRPRTIPLGLELLVHLLYFICLMLILTHCTHESRFKIMPLKSVMNFQSQPQKLVGKAGIWWTFENILFCFIFN